MHSVPQFQHRKSHFRLMSFFTRIFFTSRLLVRVKATVYAYPAWCSSWHWKDLWHWLGDEQFQHGFGLCVNCTWWLDDKVCSRQRMIFQFWYFDGAVLCSNWNSIQFWMSFRSVWLSAVIKLEWKSYFCRIIWFLWIKRKRNFAFVRLCSHFLWNGEIIQKLMIKKVSFRFALVFLLKKYALPREDFFRTAYMKLTL